MTPTSQPPATSTTRTRTDLAVRWAVGHIVEITTVAGPLVLAVWVNGWLVLGSAATAGWWALSEYRHRHDVAEQARALPPATEHHQLTAALSADRKGATAS